MAQAEPVTNTSVANYIEHMLIDLRGMSDSINAPILSYLIEMAMLEASDIANGVSSDRLSELDKANEEHIQRLYMEDRLD